ncbi:MAG: hypothetical protein HY644_02700 [Acidobacteria bacterium]|nr:hypothetical protein [Acidobacteriota bacterium]
MDPVSPEVDRLFAAKEERRKRLARLPFAEKVKVVVRLQQMAVPLLRRRGRQVRAWNLEEPQGDRPRRRVDD